MDEEGGRAHGRGGGKVLGEALAEGGEDLGAGFLQRKPIGGGQGEAECIGDIEGVGHGWVKSVEIEKGTGGDLIGDGDL